MAPTSDEGSRPLRTAIWVGVAGFFGAIARYGVAGLVSRVDEGFPWGTFVVNVSGCFLLGLLVAMFAHRFVVHPDLRVALTVGFLGAYTTFSTFALETFEFGETHSAGLAVVNVVMSLATGLAAVWLGTALGRSL
ncbi:MAG TPA: fluoride efflux transporter CrcB [Actinomycetota bacterium]|nr:fluoride efflux transporter CrcB [Actinomycetota bacterium]